MRCPVPILDTINHYSKTNMNQTLLTQAPQDSTLVGKPYYIQLGTINRPLSVFRGQRLSDAVETEYMGNSHFEFGAMPKSLRALQLQFEMIKVRKVESITDKDGYILRVLSALSDQDWEIYKKHLHDLRDDKIRTEETTRFAKDYHSKFNNTDFWWDIGNHVMWSFDKQFMNRLKEHLSASLAFMDEQKKAQENG